MYMAYTTNPYLPRLRMKTANLVRLYGWSVRQAARHIGVEPSTVSRWVKKAEYLNIGVIPTESSRPHSHPRALPEKIVNRIVELRERRNRCAEIVHREMINLGYLVSLSSVKRTLRRRGLIRKRSPWKRWHFSEKRPDIAKPGDLVQIDTVHIIPGILYVYTLLDIFSRWAYARVSERINTHKSLRFVKLAQRNFSFPFKMLQSDHGSEFSTYFSEHILVKGCGHRHSRVRKPNDNGHLERFNRTLKEECLRRTPKRLKAYQRVIPEYLEYYNKERLHLGLEFKTPQQVLRSY